MDYVNKTIVQFEPVTGSSSAHISTETQRKATNSDICLALIRISVEEQLINL